MSIRLATASDIPRIVQIFETARAFMRSTGNLNQWNAEYPHEDTFADDIEHGWLHVLCDNGCDGQADEDGGGSANAIYAACALIAGDDPTYAWIDGQWLSDTPYATFHRIASDGTHHGVFSQFVAYARERYDHLRVDTHKDNLPMQRAALKNGFVHCGTIITTDGTPRMAFEWIGGHDGLPADTTR